jgi:hypothetical protein
MIGDDVFLQAITEGPSLVVNGRDPGRVSRSTVRKGVRQVAGLTCINYHRRLRKAEQEA